MVLVPWRLALSAEPAPVTSLSVTTVEKRLADIERLLETSGLLDMLQQLEDLQQEVTQLRGEVEITMNQLEGVKNRQRDLYADVDRRLQSIMDNLSANPARLVTKKESADVSQILDQQKAESQTVPNVTEESVDSPQPQANGSHNEVNAVVIQAGYQRAFNLLKQSKYDQAIKALNTFLQTYPENEYSDNAQYWVAEALYVSRQYKEAIQAYTVLINNYPDSTKVPNSLLKIGDSHHEMGEQDKARLWYNQVRQDFPDSTSANLAKDRLQKISNL